MTTPAQRAALKALMDYALTAGRAWHYPSPAGTREETIHTVNTLGALQHLLRRPQGLTVDCSQTVTLLFHVAGLKDPNGNRYRTDGYTGTLLNFLPHYTNPKHALTGALVVYGPGSGEHVSIVYKPDAEQGDPLLFSHGLEAGPLLVNLSVQRRAHRRPVTFLNVSQL